MICITGDIHGEVERLKQDDIRSLRKGDTLLVCGDFGLIWQGGAQEEKILKSLGKRKYNILFLDGIHENFELLRQYPLEEFKGGLARKISGNLYHLQRGEIYTLEDKRFFCFGGGNCSDMEREIRIREKRWWPEAVPTLEEMQAGVEKLRQADNEVDYILTFEPPVRIKKILNKGEDETNSVNSFFEQLGEHVTYKHWFFGSCHVDKKLTALHTCVYNDMLMLEELTPQYRPKK